MTAHPLKATPLERAFLVVAALAFGLVLGSGMVGALRVAEARQELDTRQSVGPAPAICSAPAAPEAGR